MAIVEVKVPQLSESVAEATLLQWKKKPGDAVAIDEILIEVETDKVVLEVPAPAAGVPRLLLLLLLHRLPTSLAWPCLLLPSCWPTTAWPLAPWLAPAKTAA